VRAGHTNTACHLELALYLASCPLGCRPASLLRIPCSWQQHTFNCRGAPGFDTVLSDMAPSTSGIAAADATQSLDLAQCAADLALGGAARLLAPSGHLVVKLLEVDVFCCQQTGMDWGLWALSPGSCCSFLMLCGTAERMSRYN
jgi:23S rRNA U2552 (ribose-2'-O)-methylase RlmE/FtsJ